MATWVVVVASDKTGTLTANEMRVVVMHTADGVDPDRLWRAAALCNDADIAPDGDPVGDPTEVALLRGADDAEFDWRSVRDSVERDDEMPFDSATKRMAVVIGSEVFAKGAPEVLLDSTRDAGLVAAVDDMSARALRTLAIASGPAPVSGGSDDEVFAAAVPIGVVGIADPPRPAAIDAVAVCHRAGLMILWNNLIIDVIPSFALALEPSSDDAMSDAPRPTGEPVLGAGTVGRIVVQGLLVGAVGLTAYLLARGPLDLALDEARTVTFIAITTAKLLAVFNARTDRGSGFRGATTNPYLWGALALTVTLEALALGVGPLRDLLGLTVLSPTAWVVALSLATVPVVTTQAVRIWRDSWNGPARASALMVVCSTANSAGLRSPWAEWS